MKRGVSCKCLAFDRLLARRLQPVSVTTLEELRKRVKSSRGTRRGFVRGCHNLAIACFWEREKEKTGIQQSCRTPRFVRSPDQQKNHILITGAKSCVSRWVAAFLCELYLAARFSAEYAIHSIFCACQERRKRSADTRDYSEVCIEKREKKRNREKNVPPSRRGDDVGLARLEHACSSGWVNTPPNR